MFTEIFKVVSQTEPVYVQSKKQDVVAQGIVKLNEVKAF